MAHPAAAGASAALSLYLAASLIQRESTIVGIAQMYVSRLLSQPARPGEAASLLDAATDITAFADFPSAHWKKIWSTNPLERLNWEIKRRADVLHVLPNLAALDRPAAAVLTELHDEWQALNRRYFSQASMAEPFTTQPTSPEPQP